MSMGGDTTWVGKKPLRRVGGMSDALSIAADLGFTVAPPPSQVSEIHYNLVKLDRLYNCANTCVIVCLVSLVNAFVAILCSSIDLELIKKKMCANCLRMCSISCCDSVGGEPSLILICCSIRKKFRICPVPKGMI